MSSKLLWCGSSRRQAPGEGLVLVDSVKAAVGRGPSQERPPPKPVEQIPAPKVSVHPMEPPDPSGARSCGRFKL